MVFADFLTETRKRWLKAFKVFRNNKLRKGGKNRVTPLVRSPSYSGTVDARCEIDVKAYRRSLPASACCNFYDSAYGSAANSPALPILQFREQEDSSSILTEYTILEEPCLPDEETQNAINENIEIVSSL